MTIYNSNPSPISRRSQMKITYLMAKSYLKHLYHQAQVEDKYCAYVNENQNYSIPISTHNLWEDLWFFGEMIQNFWGHISVVKDRMKLNKHFIVLNPTNKEERMWKDYFNYDRNKKMNAVDYRNQEEADLLKKKQDEQFEKTKKARYRARSEWSGVPYKVLTSDTGLVWKLFEIFQSFQEAKECAEDLSGLCYVKVKIAYVTKIRIDHDPDETGIDVFIYRRLKPSRDHDLYYAKVKIPVYNYERRMWFHYFVTKKINLDGTITIRSEEREDDTGNYIPSFINVPKLEFYRNVNRRVKVRFNPRHRNQDY